MSRFLGEASSAYDERGPAGSGVYGSIAIVYVMRIGLIAIDGCFGSAIASIIDIVRVADGA
ncbi:hypothetical protein Q9S36_10445, partial [Microbacterium sp. ARD31]|nr:hypothetical protein [Microbacterium sp. ARD31]